MKTTKRLISSNVGKDGSLNLDAFQKAILQYRNTPDPATKQSPAMCVFGRPTRDLIPILPGKCSPRQDNISSREQALRHRHTTAAERWTEHSRALPPLRVGDHVMVQNQTGNHPTKWDRTATVIEVKQYRSRWTDLGGCPFATSQVHTHQTTSDHPINLGRHGPHHPAGRPGLADSQTGYSNNNSSQSSSLYA